MGECVLIGLSVDEQAIAGVVGSGDASVVAKALSLEAIVRDLDGGFAFTEPPTSTKSLLSEVVAGRLDRQHALEYRRLLEVLGEALGARLLPRFIVTPGYGLRKLGAVLPHWGLKTLAAIWSRDDVSFPFPESIEPDPWPKLMMIRGDELRRVLAEVRAFEGREIFRGLTGDPAADAFLTEPGELLADPCDPHLSHLFEGIAAWVTAVDRGRGHSLLMMMDGDQ